MKKLEVLKEKEFNTVEAETKINKAINELNINIDKVNKLATKSNIYIQIDSNREAEKVIKSLYPFLHNTNISLSSYDIKGNIKKIHYEYDRRFQTALYCIGFVSINEKTKVIKCKKKYGFLSLDLYYLNRIATFQTNLNNTGKDSDCIEILKEYSNLNVEFKFKSEIDYETFKSIVFYSNNETNYIINNAPDEIINEYKQKKKENCYNEVSILHKWAKNNYKDFSYSKPINTNLINKCWGC